MNLLILLLLPGQIEPALAPDFPRDVQLGALTATVQVTDAGRQVSGSGVILGRNGPLVYILTARHVVEGAKRLEISTFSKDSYPKPSAVFRSVRVEAMTEGPADLALLRLVTTEEMPGTLRLCLPRQVPDGAGFAGLTVGCDAGQPPRCVVDKVAGKKLVRHEARGVAAAFWEIDRKQATGRSGGPLVDRQGRLLGVCSGTSGEKSYYSHSDEIQKFLKAHGFRWLTEPEK